MSCSSIHQHIGNWHWVTIGVALLRFLKPMHTRSFLFFLYIGTTLDIHSAYLHCLMNFASINFVISAFISGRILGLHHLDPC